MDQRKMMVGIGAAAVAVIAGIGIFLLIHTSSPDSKPAPKQPSTGQHATKSQPTSPSTSSTGGSGSNGSSSGDVLTDTGPGDVVGVFLAASALSYVFFIRRRLRILEADR